MKEPSTNTDESGFEQWTTPPAGFIKVNFDGAVFTSENAVGFGVVARDAEGSWIAWKKRRMRGSFDAATVKALAAKFAMEIVNAYGCDQIILEGDCLNVLREIENKKKKSLSVYGNIIEDIHRAGGRLGAFKVNFVRRVANQEAHALARAAMVEEGTHVSN